MVLSNQTLVRSIDYPLGIKCTISDYWASTRRTYPSIGRGLTLDRECIATRWKRRFLHSSTDPRLGRGNWMTGSMFGWVVWPIPWLVHPKWLENLYFSKKNFTSNILAKSLSIITCQVWKVCLKFKWKYSGFNK